MLNDNSMYRKIITIAVFALSALSLSAQTAGSFIFGTVYTTEGKKYKGFIGFGDEAFMWNHFFISDKQDNPYYKYIPENKKIYRRRIKETDGTLRIISRDYNTPVLHNFIVRFGNISTLEVISHNDILLEMKGDKYIRLNNRIGHHFSSISIYDSNIGKMKIDRHRIRRIEFSQAGNDAVIPFSPLYGTVNCKYGTFKGMIRWDKDEYSFDDKIDGDYDGASVAIKLKNIRSITKAEKGSIIRANNGQEYYFTGSNDIDSGNRGIVVNMPNVGEVVIDWSDFISAEFYIPEKISGNMYSDYQPAERLKGRVVLHTGNEHRGVMVYDLDEAVNTEVLDGVNGGLRYRIPFKYIKSIKPLSPDFSKVSLINGTELFLGGESDLSYKNDGLLIFQSSDEWNFFYWNELKEIIFE